MIRTFLCTRCDHVACFFCGPDACEVHHHTVDVPVPDSFLSIQEEHVMRPEEEAQ